MGAPDTVSEGGAFSACRGQGELKTLSQICGQAGPLSRGVSCYPDPRTPLFFPPDIWSLGTDPPCLPSPLTHNTPPPQLLGRGGTRSWELDTWGPQPSRLGTGGSDSAAFRALPRAAPSAPLALPQAPLALLAPVRGGPVALPGPAWHAPSQLVGAGIRSGPWRVRAPPPACQGTSPDFGPGIPPACSQQAPREGGAVGRGREHAGCRTEWGVGREP